MKPLRDLMLGALLGFAILLSVPSSADLGVNVTSFIASGPTFTLGAGTGACLTTTTLTGGRSAGSFLCTGTAGASTIVVNLPTAPSGWACHASDETAGTIWEQSAHTTASCTIAGAIGVTSDRVVFSAIGY